MIGGTCAYCRTHNPGGRCVNCGAWELVAGPGVGEYVSQRFVVPQGAPGPGVWHEPPVVLGRRLTDDDIARMAAGYSMLMFAKGGE